MLQQNYISKKSSELIGQEDSSMDKKEKFLYEDSSNEDLNIKEMEKAKIELMRQYNSNDNIVNYNIFNKIKVDNRSFNISSVGSQFVTNSYINRDEVFLHKDQSFFTGKVMILLLLIIIVIAVCIIIFVFH